MRVLPKWNRSHPRLTAQIALALLWTPLVSAQEQRVVPLLDANTANLPAQRIGANDLIAVSVYGSPEFSRTLRVGADGTIRLPMIKSPLRAAGRMPSELDGIVADALKTAGLIVEPLVTVTVVEYQSRPISVMGAVRLPVTFQATGPTRLLEALARAQGLSADAGAEILVSNIDPGQAGGSLIRRVPVKALLGGSDPALNLELFGGEEIRVPEGGKVFVVGNVKKPGAFGMGDEPATTVLKAVALAEGLMPYAAKQGLIYRREAVGSMNEVPVEIGRIMDRKSPDMVLLANDVLYIPDAKGRRIAWSTVERILLFGSGATTALIYGAAVH